MLHSLETLIGASVHATDGEMGKVNDFLFDDQSWLIRYLVVDVWHWLSRRDVLIAASAAEQPDWTQRSFHVHLTKDQVRHSPDVDTRKPVSRQQEIAMRDYYGWPSYLNANYGEIISVPVTAGRSFPVGANEDPHLRSTESLRSYHVWADDGEIGTLQNYIVDQNSWHIGYLDVQAGDWLLRRSVLFPTRWVKAISWPEHRVDLEHSRQAARAQ